MEHDMYENEIRLRLEIVRMAREQLKDEQETPPTLHQILDRSRTLLNFVQGSSDPMVKTVTQLLTEIDTQMGC